MVGLTVVISACGQVVPSTGATAATPSAAALVGTPVPSVSPSLPALLPSPGALGVGFARSQIRLPAPRSRAVALALGSEILVCGGLTAAGTTTGTIIGLDLGSGRATELGTLAVPVHDAGGTVLGGSGFVIGGGSAAPVATVQEVGATGSTVTSGRLPAVRADLAAVPVDGEIVVVGGGTPARSDGAVLATSDGRSFRLVAQLVVAVRYPAVAVAGGRVYVFGGSTPAGDTAVIQAVDPSTGLVRIAGHLPHGLSHASALAIRGALLIAGGREAGRAQDAVWLFDAASGTVTRVGTLPYAVSDMASVVAGGTGYLIGGEAFGPLASIISVR